MTSLICPPTPRTVLQAGGGTASAVTLDDESLPMSDPGRIAVIDVSQHAASVRYRAVGQARLRFDLRRWHVRDVTKLDESKICIFETSDAPPGSGGGIMRCSSDRKLAGNAELRCARTSKRGIHTGPPFADQSYRDVLGRVIGAGVGRVSNEAETRRSPHRVDHDGDGAVHYPHGRQRQIQPCDARVRVELVEHTTPPLRSASRAACGGDRMNARGSAPRLWLCSPL